MAFDALPVTTQLLEGVLRRLGLDPAAAKVRQDETTIAWGIMRGSAQVLLAAATSDKGTWVRVVAPVVKLPKESDRLAFFARLLDLNAKAMRNAAFGVLNDDVVIVSERPAQGLDAGEVEQILKHVGAAADYYDDLFAKEYGLAKSSAS
jgi:hypothetical protein